MIVKCAMKRAVRKSNDTWRVCIEGDKDDKKGLDAVKENTKEFAEKYVQSRVNDQTHVENAEARQS